MHSQWLQHVLLSVASGFIVSSQIIDEGVLVQAQETQDSTTTSFNLSATEVLKGTWIGENYQCPRGTFHQERIYIDVTNNSLLAIKIDGDACVPALQETFSGTTPALVSPGTSFPVTWVTGFPGNPMSGKRSSTLKVINMNTFESDGVKFTRTSLQSNNSQPDYSACSYYDEVARTNNCKYHALAGKICRDDYSLTNLFTSLCSLLSPGEITVEEKNCIRSCLALNDKIIREQVSFCQINCNGETCTRQECIDAYHNSCFESCSVTKTCYGGNWPYPYDNDDQKCLVKLNSGICLISR